MNLAVSGGTSADLLRRIDQISGLRPSWVLIMIGTNDARRHGRDGIAQMSSLAETERNIDVFRELVEQLGARTALVTPPPIDADRVSVCETFTSVGISWRTEDIDAIATAVRQRRPTIIDVHGDLSSRPAETMMSDDGIHPSFDGQKQITRTVVESLAATANGRVGSP